MKTKKKVSLQDFIKMLWSEFNAVEQQIIVDKEKVSESNIFVFLRWSDNAFQHAAYHRWLGIYLDLANKMLKSKKTLADFREHITVTHLQDAAMLSQSSNPTCDLMDRCEKAARARIINYLNHGVTHNNFG